MKKCNFDFDPSPQGRGGASGLDFRFRFCAQNLVSGSYPGMVVFSGWGAVMETAPMLEIRIPIPTTGAENFTPNIYSTKKSL